MRIIAFIQDPAVIEKILRHLGQRDPPRAPSPPTADESRRIEYDEYCQDSHFALAAHEVARRTSGSVRRFATAA